LRKAGGNDILRLVPKINYSRLPTEQNNPRTRKIDTLSTPEILKLIHEEDRLLPLAVWKVQSQIARGVNLIAASLQNGGRLFFAGAGTSGRLGVIEAAECPPTFNTPPSLVQAVMAGGRKAVFRSQEGAEDRRVEALQIFRRKLKKGDVLVGIAASGVTPFVQGAFQAAKEKKARTLLVTCNPSPAAKNLFDYLIAPNVGPEVISGSTRLKAGTATKLILNMLTVASMIRLGKVYRNWMVDLQPKSKKLKARALRLIEYLGSVPPKDSEKHLLRAKGKVKHAILMAKRNWDYKKASKALKETRGFLAKALLL
jgi:N-acetylmuramic acid 6-phosphate etherase